MGLQKRIACNRISACKIGKGVSFTHFNKKKKHPHQCLHSYCSFAFNILLFFSLSFTLLSLFLSGTSHSHLTLFFFFFLSLSLSSTSHSSCATDLRCSLTQLCHRWLPHLSMLSSITVAFFFLCLMVFGFWLVGFGGFDQWFLMILISGF